MRVVALTSARREAWFVELNFQVVIFVGAFGRGGGEGDFVVWRDIGKAFLQERGDIVVVIENETAALNGEDLEAEISGGDLAGFADAFDELLVVGGAQEGFVGAERIDVVDSDTGLQELRIHADYVGENLGLLFGVYFDARARQKRPSGRNPEHDFAAWVAGFAGRELTKSLQGKLQAFAGAVEAAGAADIAQTDVLAIESSAEFVAIAREISDDLDAFVGEDSEGDGVGEMASFGAEEFGNLVTLETEDAVINVDGVNYDEDVGGSFAARDDFEGSYGLGGFVVEQSEVLLLEIGDGWARFWANHDVEEDLICGGWAWRRSLLRGVLSRGCGGGK